MVTTVSCSNLTQCTYTGYCKELLPRVLNVWIAWAGTGTGCSLWWHCDMAGWLMDPSEVHFYTRETDISSSRETYWYGNSNGLFTERTDVAYMQCLSEIWDCLFCKSWTLKISRGCEIHSLSILLLLNPHNSFMTTY